MKATSADVIGLLSSHTALGLRWKVSVNGAALIPPLASVGASVIKAEGWGFPLGSRYRSLGRTY